MNNFFKSTSKLRCLKEKLDKLKLEKIRIFDKFKEMLEQNDETCNNLLYENKTSEMMDKSISEVVEKSINILHTIDTSEEEVKNKINLNNELFIIDKINDKELYSGEKLKNDKVKDENTSSKFNYDSILASVVFEE